MVPDLCACFGIELTINHIAAIYYHDFFQLDLKTAGLFGVMNLFERTVSDFFGDKAGFKCDLKDRVGFLGVVLSMEDIALILLSQMTLLSLAIGTMILLAYLPK